MMCEIYFNKAGKEYNKILDGIFSGELLIFSYVFSYVSVMVANLQKDKRASRVRDRVFSGTVCEPQPCPERLSHVICDICPNFLFSPFLVDSTAWSPWSWVGLYD